MMTMELGMMISSASEWDKRKTLAQTIRVIRNINGDSKFSNAY